MSHIKIYRDGSTGGWQVEVDGENVTNAIANGGVRVEFRKWPLPPLVTLTLVGDVDMDLPDTELKAPPTVDPVPAGGEPLTRTRPGRVEEHAYVDLADPRRGISWLGERQRHLLRPGTTWRPVMVDTKTTDLAGGSR